MTFRLNALQIQVRDLPLEGATFLEGPAGAGKTTAGVHRLNTLIKKGVPGQSMLVLVPQRTLAGPYNEALSTISSGGVPSIVTLGGLARRLIDLFWPLVSDACGFAHPEQPPNFLTLETSQYFMAHLLRPKLDEGWFSSVRIPANRLYSQVLDNLNKAALVGYPLAETGKRLSAAWVGDPEQLHVVQDIQASVDLFRSFCLQHNLLDFSLQMEIFSQQLWKNEICRSYLERQYQHLIYDNIEEDTPVAHDLLLDWRPGFRSSLFIFDHEAGFRSFLGADPHSAYRLKEDCQQQLSMENSQVISEGIQHIGRVLIATLAPSNSSLDPQQLPDFQASQSQSPVDPGKLLKETVSYAYHRYYPQMLDWVAEQCSILVHEKKLAPHEIVILAPYLPDALRFSLVNRLEALRVPVRSHRPSRSLREEPAARCLLSLTGLAYPQWGFLPQIPDLAYALVQAIEGLDLVRAKLLSSIVLRKRKGEVILSSFDILGSEAQERITYSIGERFERLRLWLEQAGCEQQELDTFLSRLFGEILSQPGFGFHRQWDAAQVTANLVESVQKFRWAVAPTLAGQEMPLGQEYLRMVQDGVIAAQYLAAWDAEDRGAVLVAPAYTFLLSNRPAQVQFWLDIGSSGWAERLFQPLTHPYVLGRDWPVGKQWTDQDEVQLNHQTLYRLVLGLLRRCSGRVYLGLSELGEQGFEQRGEFLRAFQRALQQVAGEEGVWQPSS